MVGLFVVVGGSLVLMGKLWRDKREAHLGSRESEEALAELLTHVEAAYARDKRLCGSSLFESTDTLGASLALYAETGRNEPMEAEISRHVGFACLGVSNLANGYDGKNAYTYESDGTHFVLRGFRAYLYDPNGRIPRFERRGELRDGRLVIDPMLYEISPGGPSFKGHPGPGF